MPVEKSYPAPLLIRTVSNFKISSGFVSVNGCFSNEAKNAGFVFSSGIKKEKRLKTN